MDYKEHEEGTLIPFHAFYDALENFLDHSHRGVIIKAYDNSFINPDHKTKDVFAINVLKTLFMIKYVNNVIEANLDNITSLMISDIEDDRIELKAKVEDALKVLQRQILVQRNGEIYVFLTDEEQEINREIESQNVEMAEVINKASEMIFEDIFTDKKYRYPAFNGRYAFGFNSIVDDRPYKSNQNYDIGVHILTPAADMGMDETTLRMISGQGREVLAVLPDDRAFMEEIQRYLKIEKFLRLNTSSALPQYETIKDGKRKEMRERNANAKLYLSESLKDADIYVNGDKAQINAKEVSARINEALGRLVSTVYHKLSYIDAAYSEDDISKLFKTSNQISLNLEGGTEPNVHALDDVLSYIADNTRMHMKTSMKSIKDRFMKAPYGFVEDDVHWLVAKLFRRGDLAFYVNGSSVSTHNKDAEELINYITKKSYVDKLMIEQKVRVSEKEKKITKDIMKELFGTAGNSDDEDVMMSSFIGYADKLTSALGKLEVRYESTRYPGKNIVEYGKKLLLELVQIQTPTEFFQTVAKKQDELLDFAEDYEPVKAFFNSEQKTIFDKAILYLSKYDDSKTYIVDENLENIVSQISGIVKKQSPYSDIPKLPELLKKFGDVYSDILDEQLKPVLDSVYDSQKRVFDVLNTKEYAETRRSRYSAMFDEIIDAAKGCTNVSVLRGYADRAEALKMRLLNEITQMDRDIALKKAEEVRKKLEEQAKAVGNVDQAQIEAEVQKKVEKVKKTKNISIKSMTKTASWRLETTEDVDRYLNELRLKLVNELDTDTIVNIEF